MANVERNADGVVVVDYATLNNPDVDLRASIEAGFGTDPNCLGLILVRGVPNYVAMRRRLLPLSSRFAQLADEVKEKFADEKNFYMFGWSHGKEKLGDKPDLAKGSYYNNPCYDKPTDDEELIKAYPEYCGENIWPDQHIPDFQPAFKELGQLIVDVGQLLARHCDKYVSSHAPDFPPQYLEKVISDSRAFKARLLHYFPFKTEDDSEDVASWCGWHLDHSSLTGLTSAMYIDESLSEVKCSDPKAGLYIRTRGNAIIKVSIPEDHIAFQIGEASQIASNGCLKATPHCVRAAQTSGQISRDTFAVFMQPTWDHMLRPDLSFIQYTKQLLESYY